MLVFNPTYSISYTFRWFSSFIITFTAAVSPNSIPEFVVQIRVVGYLTIFKQISMKVKSANDGGLRFIAIEMVEI